MSRRPLSVDSPAVTALVGVGGALPTLVSAATGPSFLVDDWAFADTARHEGLAGFAAGTDVHSRPLQALYHAVTFLVLTDHPVLHVLLLAALNGVAAMLVLRVARTVVAARPALLVTLWWLVLPNRGATRLWISTGPVALALVLVLLAALAALRDPPSVLLAAAPAAASALAYESGIALGTAIVAIAVWRSTPSGPRRVVGLAALVAVAVVLADWIYLSSPKRQGSTPASAIVGAAADTVPALLGAGLLPGLLRAAGFLVPVAVVAGLVACALPSAPVPPPARLLLVAGAAVTALGAAPVIATGLSPVADGPGDRVNTFALLGVAMMLGGLCELVAQRAGLLGVGITGVALVVVASANITDVADTRAAQADGRGLLDALVALDPPPGEAAVILPMPDHGGWLPFGYTSIRSAYRLETGQARLLYDPRNEDEVAVVAHVPGPRYRYADGTLVPD